MLRKFTILVITALFGNGFSAYAQTPSPKEIKIKQQIVERGTNQKVKIKLTSNETLEGRISDIRNDSFTLQFVDPAGQVINRDLAYSELSNVSKTGTSFKRGFLQGVGIYLGMAAVAAVMLGIGLATSR